MYTGIHSTMVCMYIMFCLLYNISKLLSFGFIVLFWFFVYVCDAFDKLRTYLGTTTMYVGRVSRAPAQIQILQENYCYSQTSVPRFREVSTGL